MRSRIVGGLAAMTIVVAGCTSDPAAPPTLRTHQASSLDVPRAVHRATVLADGRVLLTGGCTAPGCEDTGRGARTEVFVPATDRIGYGPRLATARLSHTATRLRDGRVLVIGGYPGEGMAPTATMEIVDVGRGSAEPSGSLRVARADHTATLLADGRVLVAGGRGANGAALRSAEIVDPTTGRSRLTTSMPAPRSAADAVLVGERVLVVGGTAATDVAVAGTEWFDPTSGGWSRGPDLLRPRVKHGAVAIAGGTVLVAGGASSTEGRDRFDDTEVLDPGASRFRPGPRLSDGRYKLADAVAALADGRVVVGGGPTLDVIDLGAATVRSVPVRGLSARLSFQTVSPLPGSRVLMAGGYDDAIVPTDLLRVVRIP